MSEIILRGLSGSHPLGALAAIGLLRCCQDLAGVDGARLGWRREGDWVAVLKTEPEVSEDSLIEMLAIRQQTRLSAPEMNWTDDIKTTHETFLAAARDANQELLQGRRGFADYLNAF